jgi:hypothetical protein
MLFNRAVGVILPILSAGRVVMGITAAVNNANGVRVLGSPLIGVGRCPHCAIATPLLDRVWYSQGRTAAAVGHPGHFWAAYKCSTCGGIVTARSDGHSANTFFVEEIFPPSKVAHEDIPEPARSFLQQAYETLHAPDASALMAGSAVDAFLKAKSYVKGSLYERIDQALADAVLTQGMADWAHSVRLGANRPRHADADNPHVSPEEAQRSVEFAEALGNFLFVLTARVERGIRAASEAAAEAETQGVGIAG